jgi:hypothetical protein
MNWISTERKQPVPLECQGVNFEKEKIFLHAPQLHATMGQVAAVEGGRDPETIEKVRIGRI